jgi:hypothetical protein
MNVVLHAMRALMTGLVTGAVALLLIGLMFHVGLGWQDSVLARIGAWRNRAAARRTLRLLYRIATTCPRCGHDALKTWHRYGVCCGELDCHCGYHGALAVLPQPPAPECSS